jgi:hypothetical protein
MDNENETDFSGSLSEAKLLDAARSIRQSRCDHRYPRGWATQFRSVIPFGGSAILSEYRCPHCGAWVKMHESMHDGSE